jgi:Cu(I)/Ag(I) efflux system membrane fusion protein
MYATVRLSGGATEPRPLVPESAIVSSGERELVIRALGDGRFRPVPVRTGRSANGRTQVLHGLDGGERVVTSAQFLLDSEARLSGALAAMGDSTMSGGGGGHQH